MRSHNNRFIISSLSTRMISMIASLTTMELRSFLVTGTGIYSSVKSNKTALRNKFNHFRHTRVPRGKLRGLIPNLNLSWLLADTTKKSKFGVKTKIRTGRT